MFDDSYGYSTTLADPNASLATAPAKVPDVKLEDGSGVHEFTDFNKSTKVILT